MIEAAVIDQLAPAAALVLSPVFAWAGIAKLVNQASAKASFAGLGLPRPGVSVALVSAAEAGVGIGLVLWPSRAAWPALALLVLFSAVVSRAVARGAQIPCACFGSSATRPVSWLDIARNAGLGALALVAARSSGGPSTRATLAAVVIVSTTVALARVGLAMAELRSIGGRVFATPLPGEARR